MADLFVSAFVYHLGMILVAIYLVRHIVLE